MEDTHRIVSTEMKSMQKKLKKMKRLIRQTRHTLKMQEIKTKVQQELQNNEGMLYSVLCLALLLYCINTASFVLYRV
ncbi:hypothetical protein EON65_10245 [archaeon]|nr:MAG: hypothetical protein EON65_10245 [archaeon]